MSILFDKLRGLKKEPDTPRNKDKKLSPKRDVYNFRRFVFSPVGAIITLSFVVLFGALSFYTLYFIKTYLDKSNTRRHSIKTAQVQNSAENAPQQELQEFLETDGLKEDAFSMGPEPENPVNDPKLDADSPILSKDTGPEPETPPLEDKAAVNMDEIQELSGISPAEDSPDETLPPEKETNLPEPSSQTFEEIEHQKKRLLLHKKTKSMLKMSQMTKEIEAHLRNNDFAKADELINTLISLKKSDNHYLLKLKAFIDIKSGKLESASRLLEKILDKNPEDLEAGLNMAVVEIKQNRFDLAKTRLLKLRENHPASNRIEALLKQL